MQQKRRWWDILVTGKSAERLVFIDETGANTKMIRRYGWGPRSARVVSNVPFGHWKTTTFVGALRTLWNDGPYGCRWSNEWGYFPGVCATGVDQDIEARRHRDNG